MITLVVFHHVRDYDTWKTVFDEHEPVRLERGQTEQRVYRGLDDAKRVVVHVDFPSQAAARGFMADPSLPPAIERAGVVDEPWLGLVVPIGQKHYADGDPAVTAAVHHKVRDYDTWKAVFDEHQPVRRSHGALEHRLYHAFDEPLRLVVHIDFPTLADAEGFLSDASLPDAMARAGVEGEASISMNTLVERKATG